MAARLRTAVDLVQDEYERYRARVHQEPAELRAAVA
jgi:hypothetical protein